MRSNCARKGVNNEIRFLAGFLGLTEDVSADFNNMTHQLAYLLDEIPAHVIKAATEVFGGRL
jgi:hypothetical protein